MRARSKAKLEPLLQACAESDVCLREDGTLTLAVVADTHSRPHPKTAQWIEQLAPDAILHAGDIGDLRVLEELAALAPLIAVRGNIDGNDNALPDAVTIRVLQGDTPVLKLLLTHIAVYGPKVRAEVARLAQQQGAQLVVCGHSHVPFFGRDRGLTLFNPGSIGPRRMHLPIVFGSIEIRAGKLSLRHIDCESGQPWLPG